MTLGNFLEGVKVIAKYYEDPSGYRLSVGYDAIILGATDRPMSAYDVAYVCDLGWLQSDKDDDAYDPEDEWTAYV